MTPGGTATADTMPEDDVVILDGDPVAPTAPVRKLPPGGLRRIITAILVVVVVLVGVAALSVAGARDHRTSGTGRTPNRPNVMTTRGKS